MATRFPPCPTAEKAVSFHYQPVWKRALRSRRVHRPISSLAIVIFAAINVGYGRQVLVPRIEGVVAGSVAERAGLKAGDLIVSIDGRPIDSFMDMQRIVSTSPGRSLALGRGARAAQDVDVKVVPELKEIKTPLGRQRVGMLGVQASRDPADLRTEQLGLAPALSNAVTETWFIVERTGAYVGGLFAGTENDRPALRPDSHRSGLRPGRHGGDRGAAKSCCDFVGFDRSD